MAQTVHNRQHHQRWQSRRAPKRRGLRPLSGAKAQLVVLVALLWAGAGCGDTDSKTQSPPRENASPRAKSAAAKSAAAKSSPAAEARRRAQPPRRPNSPAIADTRVVPAQARQAISDSSGNGLLRRAADELDRHPRPLSAKIRQKVFVLGHEMVGAGNYSQMPNPRFPEGEAAQLLSRINLRLQIHDRTATWQQVCDGKFLWLESKVPDDDKTAARGDGETGYSVRRERINLADVADALADQEAPCSFYGLSHMLRVIASAFDFEPPRAKRVRGADGQTMEISLLEGRWNRRYLTALLPGLAIKPHVDPAQQLPDRMPDRVSVFLGMNRGGPWAGNLGSVPPPDLFPFRIVYGRHNNDLNAVMETMNLELYHVVIDDQKLQPFAYSPTKFRDGTSRFTAAQQRVVPR